MTRVLLAEDDTSISEPLSRALRREGYQVEVTEDGPTTLGRALSDGIDLILLDIGLPELDGLEVCRRVRAEGSGVGGGGGGGRAGGGGRGRGGGGGGGGGGVVGGGRAGRSPGGGARSKVF